MSFQFQQAIVSSIIIPSSGATTDPAGFTVEARIQCRSTAQIGDGIIVQSRILEPNHSPGSTRPYVQHGFALSVTAAGGVRFEVFSESGILAGELEPHELIRESYAPLLQETMLAPVKIFDGLWHHLAATYREGAVRIYVDGSEMYAGPFGVKPSRTLGETISIGPDPFDIGPDGRLSSAVARSALFGGYVEEVRIWRSPQPAAQIRARANSRLTGEEADLLGYFSLRTKRPSPGFPGFEVTPNEAKPARLSDGRLAGVLFDPNNEYLPVAGRPSFVVRSELHEDFKSVSTDGMTANPYSTFRTSITVLGADGRPYPCTLRFSSMVAEELTVAGKTYKLGPQLPEVPVETDGLGYVSLVSPATEQLYAPVLLAYADFMAPSERLYIYRDAALLARLEAIDAEMLRTGTPQQGGLIPGSSPEQAQMLADAVRSVMSKASRYRLTTAYETAPGAGALAAAVTTASTGGPLAREPRLSASGPGSDFAPTEMSAAPAGSAAGLRPFSFTEPLGRGIRAASVQPAPGEVRELFRFGSGDGGPLTMQNMRGRRDGLSPAEMVSLQSRGPSVTLGALTAAGPTGLADLWSSFVSGVSRAADIVFQVVQRTVADIAQGIARVVKEITVVITFVGNQIRTFVLSSIEKATELVRGLFAQLGVAASRVVEFFQEVFNWTDIQQTKGLIKQTFLSSLDRAQNELKGLKQRTIQALDGAKTQLGQTLDRAIALVDEQLSGGDKSRQSELLLGVTGRWAIDTAMQNVNASRAKPDSGLPKEKKEKMVSEVQRLLQAVVDAVTDPEIHGSLRGAVASLQQSLKDGDDAPLRFIKSLLQLLKGLSRLVLNLVSVAADAVFTLSIYLLRIIKDLLTLPLEVPILSWVYKKYVSAGNDLTVLDLGALLIAIPVTALDKLIRGTTRPLMTKTQAERIAQRLPMWVSGQSAPAAVAPQSVSRADAAMEQEDWRLCRYILSVVYTISLALDTITEPILDLLDASPTPGEGPMLGAERYIRNLPQSRQQGAFLVLGALLIFPQFGIVAGGFPINLDERGAWQPLLSYDLAAWVLQIIRTLADCVAFLAESALGASNNYKVLASLLASSHALVVGASFVQDRNAAGSNADAHLAALKKFLVNFMGCVPGMAKFLGTKLLVDASEGVTLATLVAADILANLGATAAAGVIAYDNAQSLPGPRPAAVSRAVQSSDSQALSQSHVAVTADGKDMLLYFPPLQVVLHYHRPQLDMRFQRRRASLFPGCTGVAVGRRADGLFGVCTATESRPGLDYVQVARLGEHEPGKLDILARLGYRGAATSLAPSIATAGMPCLYLLASREGRTRGALSITSQQGEDAMLDMPPVRGAAVAAARELPGGRPGETYALIAVQGGRVYRHSMTLPGGPPRGGPIRVDWQGAPRPAFPDLSAKSSNPALCPPFAEIALADGGVAHVKVPAFDVGPPSPEPAEVYALDLTQISGLASYFRSEAQVETIVATGQGFKIYSRVRPGEWIALANRDQT